MTKITEKYEWGNSHIEKDSLTDKERLANILDMLGDPADIAPDPVQKSNFVTPEIIAMSQAIMIIKGGPTSGNWGHVGRPGKHGGSKAGGGKRMLGIKPGQEVSRQDLKLGSKRLQMERESKRAARKEGGQALADQKAAERGAKEYGKQLLANKPDKHMRRVAYQNRVEVKEGMRDYLSRVNKLGKNDLGTPIKVKTQAAWDNMDGVDRMNFLVKNTPKEALKDSKSLNKYMKNLKTRSGLRLSAVEQRQAKDILSRQLGGGFRYRQAKRVRNEINDQIGPVMTSRKAYGIVLPENGRPTPFFAAKGERGGLRLERITRINTPSGKKWALENFSITKNGRVGDSFIDPISQKDKDDWIKHHQDSMKWDNKKFDGTGKRRKAQPSRTNRGKKQPDLSSETDLSLSKTLAAFKRDRKKATGQARKDMDNAIENLESEMKARAKTNHDQ